MCIDTLPASMCASLTGVTDHCELPCGCRELNPGPLKERLVRFTGEPSLQPHI